MSAVEAKVDPETAEVEFQRWVSAMGLAYKIEDPKMSSEDRESLEKQKLPIIDAIRFGRLACNEAGEFVFIPQIGDTSPITFYEPDGAGIRAMDNAGKKDENIRKTYAVLAAITKQTEHRFNMMKNRDLVVCNCIFAFFMVR